MYCIDPTGFDRNTELYFKAERDSHAMLMISFVTRLDFQIVHTGYYISRLDDPQGLS